jgi:hypothetical protein
MFCFLGKQLLSKGVYTFITVDVRIYDGRIGEYSPQS